MPVAFVGMLAANSLAASFQRKALVILLKNINLFSFVFALIKSQRQMVNIMAYQEK